MALPPSAQNIYRSHYDTSRDFGMCAPRPLRQVQSCGPPAGKQLRPAAARPGLIIQALRTLLQQAVATTVSAAVTLHREGNSPAANCSRCRPSCRWRERERETHRAYIFVRQHTQPASNPDYSAPTHSFHPHPNQPPSKRRNARVQTEGDHQGQFVEPLTVSCTGTHSPVS